MDKKTSNAFSEFKKTKDFLLCVDSDGCVMDTMDIKHKKCFGPCFVEEWGLEKYRDEMLERWNEINLYSMDRGINRYKGLEIILNEINDKYIKAEGLEDLRNWVSNTKEFSFNTLNAEIEKTGSLCLKKAFNWSKMVNQSIHELDEDELLPFEGVHDILLPAKALANIAIVSSANPDAVHKEWTKHGLLDVVDILLAQDAGTKSDCIKKLMEFGYDKSKVLMIGDAPGDMSAAEANGVFFFPVLVGKEKESWDELGEVLKAFTTTGLDSKLQKQLKAKFIQHLTR